MKNPEIEGEVSSVGFDMDLFAILTDPHAPQDVYMDALGTVCEHFTRCIAHTLALRNGGDDEGSGILLAVVGPVFAETGNDKVATFAELFQHIGDPTTAATVAKIVPENIAAQLERYRKSASALDSVLDLLTKLSALKATPQEKADPAPSDDECDCIACRLDRELERKKAALKRYNASGMEKSSGKNLKH